MPAPRKGVGGGPPVGGAPARRLVRGVHYAGQGAWGGDGGARDIGVSRDMGSLAAGNPSGSRLECMYVRSKSTPFRNSRAGSDTLLTLPKNLRCVSRSCRSQVSNQGRFVRASREVRRWVKRVLWWQSNRPFDAKSLFYGHSF